MTISLSPVSEVPLSERWAWARLQAKVDREGGEPAERWRHPEVPGRFITAFGYWLYMLRWPPLSNGHAVIVASRSRHGRLLTLLLVNIAIAIAVGLLRRWPPIGVAVALAGLPWALGTVVHVITTWRSPGRRSTYLSNFIRRPGEPAGSAMPLFEHALDVADARGDTVTLHTRRERLIALYRSYGFRVVGKPRDDRVQMARSPTEANPTT